jgi:hypothetical protein
MRRGPSDSQQGTATPSGSTPGQPSGYPVCYWNSPVELVEIRGGRKYFHTFDQRYRPPLKHEVPVTL